MNDPSPRKRYWPTVVPVLVTAAALAVCLLFAGYLYLPKMVTDRLPVTQIQRMGFSDFKGRISRIGLRRTTAGPFVFGYADRPALFIHSIEIDYTPGELRRKKIRCIRIRDVIVNATLGPGGIMFPGLDLSVLAENGNTNESPSAGPSLLTAIELDKLEIRSGMINLTRGASTYKIPFEVDLVPAGPGVAKLDVHLRLFPRDQRLAVFAQVDFEHQQGRVSLDGSFVALDRFADLIHLIPGLDATGRVTIHANAMLELIPFAITDTNVDLAWHSGRLAYASAIIEPRRGEAPAVLSAVSKNLKTWRIRGDGIQLQTPVPVAMDVLAATVNLDGDMRAIAGKAELTVLPFSIEGPTPVSVKESVFLPLTFDITQKTSGDWTAGVSTTEKNQNTKLDSLDLTMAGVHIHTGAPRFSLTANGDRQGGTAHWQFNLNTIRASGAGAFVNLPSVDGKGQLQFKYEPNGPVWVGDARIQIPTPTFDGNGMAGKLDTLTLSARFQQQGGDAPAVDARLRFSNGQLNHKDSGLHLSGGRLNLPFRSNPEATGSDGTFSVARVIHNKRSMGKIQGRVNQIQDAYTFTATHVSDLFPGMTAAFTGSVRTNGSRFPDADFSFQIPSYELPAQSDLGRFIPAAQGVTLSGNVFARGKVSISRKGMDGSLEVGMAGGALTMAEQKITVGGIDTTLRFPELPRIRSGPAQQIRFTRAAMGGIVVDGGTFDVQVESENTLFVEKGRLSWCGGKVDAQSLRITAGKQDYNVSLYCHRLDLSRILEQLGSVNARGTGTVNGRIPIAYSNGNIRFDDGFLFSTPGEVGRIQLTGTDILTRGIPAGTPQLAQVELAQEALKDYTYTWAKLGLVSEGEDFIMRLQFDGKPANPLPFVYKKEIGSFVRVEVGAQGSVFQGIGLDVNLRLPLNQLLQYKDIVNMIQ